MCTGVAGNRLTMQGRTGVKTPRQKRHESASDRLDGECRGSETERSGRLVARPRGVVGQTGQSVTMLLESTLCAKSGRREPANRSGVETSTGERGWGGDSSGPRARKCRLAPERFAFRTGQDCSCK